MRPAALVLSALAALAVTLSPLLAEEPARPRPNVVFIAIDDLNDWVRCLDGHPHVRTPHIDRLAARGTLFTNAHCQSPLCNPSRTSLLTGLRPSTTGVYALQPWVRSVKQWKDVVSLPRHFTANGYRTYSTGKIWHGGYPPRDDRDGEFHVWGPPSSVGARPDEKLVETPFGNHPLVDWGTFPHRDEDRGDWQVATWAAEQLESRPEEPFFLAAGFFLPHVPCYATQKWFDLYPDDNSLLPPMKADDRDDTPRFSWYLHWELPEPRLAWLQQAKQWQPLVRAYLASISFVDSQVGRVLDALDASGMADNTIVVLWSDHGFHLGEKAISGKNTLWERSTRVPLIFAGPGISADARCHRPVELLDLYPTLIELCDLPPKPELEGHSLVPLLKNAEAERPWPAITTHGVGNHGIRTEHWRYIRYADGSQELYDLERDPHEWTNLAGDERHAAVIQEHARWLPETDAAPLPGSESRLLEIKDGTVYWENKPIDPEAPIPAE